MPTSPNADLLRAEMNRQGVTDPELRAGLAAIVGGESGFKPRAETPYTNTANSRIRRNFVASLGDKSDDFIDALKADPEQFFNYVYGAEHGVGRGLGNLNPGDGYKYRGRGGIQLTGRGNYTKLAELTGLDLVGDPELVNDPAYSAAIAVGYIRWRYNGGGWDAIKRAVGNSFGPVDAEKNRLFRQYLASGEFAPSPATPAGASVPIAAIEEVIATAKRLQGQLAAFHVGAVPLYSGPIDGAIGTESSKAAMAVWHAWRARGGR